MEKRIEEYVRMFGRTLQKSGYPDADRKESDYRKRLEDMYASEAFRQHNVYPTMNVVHVYAVIGMCLELKDDGLPDDEIITLVNEVFRTRRKAYAALIRCIDLYPGSWKIARKWNINDHEKRVRDGSITYDSFEVSEEKIAYKISRCMYVNMFEYYGIRSLCRIFCMTDETAYKNLSRHVDFIRHSDLSRGDSCHDEVMRKRKTG